MAEHPITPPPELVLQWHVEAMTGFRANGIYKQDIATLAARWGADQELEACAEWFENSGPHPSMAADVRSARRPKPPSLKERALEQYAHIERVLRDHGYVPAGCVMEALEALSND